MTLKHIRYEVGRPDYQGYTLIELVVTLIVLSILSVTAITQFQGRNTFNAPILRDQLISLTRSAQQNALGRPGVELSVTPNTAGDSVILLLSGDSGAIQSFTLELDNVSLSGDINTTDSCEVTPGANTIDNSAPLELTFGELGDLSDSGVVGSIGAVTSALRICVNNSSVASVCISPSGFAYAGDCDV